MFRGLVYLWKFGWKADKLYIIYGLLLQLINALIPLLGVTMPKHIIDELMGAKRTDVLLIWTGGFLLSLMAAKSLSSCLMLRGFDHRIRVSDKFTLFLHRKLARADYACIQDPRFLDVKARANKFLTADWHGNFYLLDEALSLIGHTFTLAGVAFIVFTLDPAVAAILFALILIQAAVDARAKRREIALSLEHASVARRGMYYSGLFEDAKYAKEIRLNGLEDWLITQEQAVNREGAAYYRRRNGFYIRSGVFAAVNDFFQQAVAYAYVVVKVIGSTIGIGDFALYTGAITTFSAEMRAMIASFMWIKSYGPYYDALKEYLDTPETLRTGTKKLPEGPFTFTFEDVGYRYPGQEVWALRHVNLRLSPGEKLSVVGENGAGKSTFIKLLTRLYGPTEGRILLNGMDIGEIDYDEYVAAFSAVFQDFQMFAFTLLQNVALGDSDRADPNRVEQALNRAGLQGRLETLPNGLHTMASRQFEMPCEFPAIYQQKESTGFEPSGGEAQKIALARALYRDAPVAVLDEPTAALDPRAEYQMYGQFDAMVKGKTAIYVSHRLSSARFCDRIAVFSKGGIVELGTHEELIVKGGLYAELYGMQAQYYADGHAAACYCSAESKPAGDSDE